MSALDPTADRPLSAQLADLIREEIRSGQRRPGSQLLSEAEFHRKYGVSRTTVRATLAILAGEGLTVTVKGQGTFVRDRQPIRRIVRGHDHSAHVASGKPIFDTRVEAAGHRPGRRMLFVGRVPVPEDVREHLKLPAEVEQIAVRKRLQLVDDEPMVISLSYYPLWYAAGTALEQPEAIPQGPDALVEEMGYIFAGCREIHSTRMPDAEEARLLTINAGGVPLFRILRIDRNTEGRPMIVSDDLYRGDRHEFVVEDTSVE
jgi:GntR family transcriptional regulator